MDKPYLNLYFREIVYHNPSTKKGSVCGVFSYEALNIEEAKLGNLYLTGKISNFPPKKHKNYDFLLGVLASLMKRDFYSDPQRNTLEALESTLQSANIYLTDFTKKGHKEWIGNLDFICFAFSKNKIHISQTGNVLIYLFRKQTMSNIAKKFSNKNETQSSKPFSNIASGGLEENDKIVIATPDLLDITPVAKLKELLSHPSAEQLYNFVKENLKDKKRAPGCLACLILEAKSKAPVIEKAPVSFKQISKIQAVDLERVLNSQSNKFTNTLKTKLPASSKVSKIALPLLKYHLPKYLIIFFLFLLIILSPYLVQKFHYATKIKQIDNLIKRTKEIISKSELSLVYQNQSEAQTLLQRAHNLIANAAPLLSQVPEKVKQESFQNLQSIQQELNSQKNSINNVININQPEEISDLSKNTFSFNPNGILKLENNLYLYELNSGFIYKIDLNDFNSPTLIFLSSKDTFKLGAALENAIILLSSPDKVYVYGKNDSYDTYLLKPDVENTFYIKDMTSYGNNLYLLDTERLNIFKYVPEENSLSGSGWLNEQYREDLIDAQSIAINGSVFVCKKDGTIIEFISGKKLKEFKPDVSPEITKGSQIFTQPDMKNLYVLDPANNRIIAINKSDNMTIQYFSNEFNSLTDFWVTPDETTIYILNGLKVFRIDI